MRISIRLTLVACSSLAALVFANAAWSAYVPNLLIAGERQTLRSPTSLVIGVSQSRDDDATSFIDISVPAGYTERLVAPPGNGPRRGRGHGHPARIGQCTGRRHGPGGRGESGRLHRPA